MNVIRSREHELFIESVNKIAPSANDDKRIIQPDKIQTLAYGFRAWRAVGGREHRDKRGTWGKLAKGKGLQLSWPKAWKSACDVGPISSGE